MAQITWRNVDAPNFSGVGDSIRTFGSMIGNATSGLSDALGNFQNAAKQEAGNAVMMNAMQYQDPTEYRNALASGALFQGVDPSLVNQRTLQNLDERAGTLLTQQGQQGTNDYNAYRFGRLQDTNSALDNASPAIRLLSEAYQSGDQNRINAALGQTREALSALPADQQLDMLGRLQGQGGQAINQAQNRFDLGVAQRNDADSQAASGILTDIFRSASTPMDALTLAESAMQNASPGVRAAIMRGVNQRFPGTYATSPSGSAPGTAGTRSGSPYDATYTFAATDKPITEMTLGEVTNHQQTMINNPSQGHSPVGAFQINKATLEDYAPKVLGSDWRNQQMTPEVQDKIAEAIFNDRKNGNLSKTWAALPDLGVGGYKDMPWSEARQLIAQAEVGAPIDQLQTQQVVSNMAGNTVAARQSEDNTGTITANYARALRDNSTIGEVADRLLKDAFKGSEKGWMIARLNKVMQESGQSPAVAAEILKQSTTNVPEGIFSRAFDAVNPSISNEGGGGIRIDDTVARELARSVRRGEGIEAIARDNVLTQVQGNIESAQNQVNQAEALLADTRRRVAAGQSGLAATIPAREAELARARAALDAAVNTVTADPGNLVPQNFRSNASVERERSREDEERAKRYRKLAEGLLPYMQPR